MQTGPLPPTPNPQDHDYPDPDFSDDNNDLLVLSTSIKDNTVRPEIVLQVDGKPMLFLVDSGAERTVIRDIKDVPVGSGSVRVLAANGKITRCSESKTVQFSLPENNEKPTVGLKVVLAPNCPHNLLGRDLLLLLGLSIGPGQDGVLVVREHIFDCMIMEGDGVPHYWWSLDLPENDPGKTSRHLLKLAKKHTKRKDTTFMSEDQLHVTLRYKLRPGPDPIYDDAVHKLGPQTLTVTYLYFDGSNSLCDVELSSAAQRLMPKPFQRHISLGRGW